MNEGDPVAVAHDTHAQASLVVERQQRRADLVRHGVAIADVEFHSEAAAQRVVRIGQRHLHPVGARAGVRLPPEEAHGAAHLGAGGEPTGRHRAAIEPVRVGFGNTAHKQHGIQIHHASARCAGLRKIAHVQTDILHHAVEGRAHAGAFDIERRRGERSLGTGQPRLRLRDRRFGLQAAVLQTHAALVFQAGLLDGRVRLLVPRLPILQGEATEQIPLLDAVAALYRPLDHTASRLGAHIHGAFVFRASPHFHALGQEHGAADLGAHRGGRRARARPGLRFRQRRMVRNALLAGKQPGRQPQRGKRGDDQSRRDGSGAHGTLLPFGLR